MAYETIEGSGAHLAADVGALQISSQAVATPKKEEEKLHFTSDQLAAG